MQVSIPYMEQEHLETIPFEKILALGNQCDFLSELLVLLQKS